MDFSHTDSVDAAVRGKHIIHQIQPNPYCSIIVLIKLANKAKPSHL